MNSINRDNYEQFFLLYADNELSAAERKAVQEFVTANPDLGEELNMLQKAILMPDGISYGDRSNLMKQAGVSDETQKLLLLLLDNELSTGDKLTIGKSIDEDGVISREWDLLKQAKLFPDKTIIYTDKPSLYKREQVRVISFPWMRIAAAAVLIGLGIWGGIAYLKNDQNVSTGEIAGASRNTTEAAKVAPGLPKAVINEVANSSQQERVAARDEIAVENKAVSFTKSSKNKISRRITNSPAIEPVLVAKKDNNLPKPSLDNFNINGSNKNITASVTPSKQPAILMNPEDQVTKNTIMQDAANVYASNASFTEDNEQSDDRILFIDEDKVKKTKIGGIFRKVKRVLERNTNLKTGGNNFRVANLEFAIQ